MAIGDLNKNKAPRTFEVMQRQDFEDASQRLLQGFDEAEAASKALAAEGMIEATRGMESGTGARLGAYRRAAQEMLPQFAQQNMMRGQTELDLIAQRGEMGDLTSDRMLKSQTYEDLIQKMWKETGGDLERIGDQIEFWIKNEKDPDMVTWLQNRGVGYKGDFGKAQRAAQAKAAGEAFAEFQMANPDLSTAEAKSAYARSI
jgi:hypothetical protein